MTVNWPAVARHKSAPASVARHAGFRRLFAPRELMLGLIMPLATYADRMADLAADVLPAFPSLTPTAEAAA